MRKTWEDVSLTYIDDGNPDGNITDSDGVSYDDLTQFITTGVLGFCGCGMPEQVVDYVKTGLELINEKSPENCNPREEWDNWYEGHRERCDKHFKTQGAEYLFYYFCDFHGLTEHGGSVPGWLTRKGEDLLELIAKEKNHVRTNNTTEDENTKG